MASGYVIIQVLNTRSGNRAWGHSTITLSQMYTISFTRCITAAGALQNMLRAIQYKHPSDSEYKFVKLIDTTKVTSRHYAVAVDIYDKRTAQLFMTFLNVLGGQDLVTLIAFGLHSATYSFKKQDYLDNEKIRSAVHKTMTRAEVGLNTLVGTRMLEKCTADVYIMISDFHRDRAPRIETQLDITYMTFRVGDPISRKFPFIEHGPHERRIRSLFNIPGPRYFNMTLDSTENLLVPSPPNGGSCTIQLPPGEIIGLTVSYMLSDGTVKHVDCELQDDETLTYNHTHMRDCDMFE